MTITRDGKSYELTADEMCETFEEQQKLNAFDDAYDRLDDYLDNNGYTHEKKESVKGRFQQEGKLAEMADAFLASTEPAETEYEVWMSICADYLADIEAVADEE